MNKDRLARLFALFVILGVLLTACGGTAAIPPTPTVVIPPTQTASPKPTASPEPTVTSTPAPTATPASVVACKLQPYAFTNVGFGLPNPSYKLPSQGDVKTIVLFADFSDAPATQTPEEVFALISPNAEKFYSALSYGRMNWQLEPHLTWLSLSKPGSYYGDAIGSYDGHLGFIQEAVKLADADVDFSTADSVVVMVPPQASAVGYGPAFGANEGEGYKADGKTFSNGVTSGADLLSWGYLWLNHESGHTMGLPDLYSYSYDPANYDDQFHFSGGFSLMGYISGKAPEFFAFERWQLGWLDDNQIICQQEGDATTTLSAIESNGGIKAVIVPISNSKLVVVESRRALGYDVQLPKEGALVYVVDTSIPSGEGPLKVYPVTNGDPYRYKSPLAVGESLTVENVTITVVEATSEGDTVQVAVTK